MFDIKDFIEDLREGDTDWEIDLSPLLALMVTLIPVLLLQTSFITMKMLETTLPVLSDKKVEKNIEDDKNKIDFELNIFFKNNNEFVLETNVNKKRVSSYQIKAKDKKVNYTELRSKLLEIKNKYPEQVSAKLIPEDKVKYDSIVKTLDHVREMEAGKFVRYTSKKGEKLETSMLFPDVIFGNIAE